MNKPELISEICELCELSKRDVEAVVSALPTVVGKALSEGDKVSLVGLGTFSVSERSARECKNPRTGEVIQVAATKTPKFKAGEVLKRVVKESV